jgi:hypothetical protein
MRTRASDTILLFFTNQVDYLLDNVNFVVQSHRLAVIIRIYLYSEYRLQ